MALDKTPELGGQGREVIDAALHLIDEEMQIAERLERKAREHWQLVAFMAPVMFGTALTAVSVKGVEAGWIIAIGILAGLSLAVLLCAMRAASAMSDVREEEGLNPDRIEAYVADLDERRATNAAFDQVRADLATSLAAVARSRATGNDARRTQLKKTLCWSRLAVGVAALAFLVASVAVVVNA